MEPRRKRAPGGPAPSRARRSPRSASDRELIKAAGERIRGLRIARGMSQQELGERAGVSQSTISNLERGKQATPIYVLIRVARALRMTTSALLGERQPRKIIRKST